eukprot:8333421-Pyramimonas_sp.AAC.1
MQTSERGQVHDEDARALEGHVGFLQAGRGQRKRPRRGRRSKDARGTLGKVAHPYHLDIRERETCIVLRVRQSDEELRS